MVKLFLIKLSVNVVKGIQMVRATVGEITDMIGFHENTIRNYADRGSIESKRDFRGGDFSLNH